MSSSPESSAVRRRLRAFYDDEMSERAGRPLARERVERLARFIDELGDRRAGSVLELGCGAGRDGVAIRDAGIGLVGVDLSASAVRLCRGLGLAAVQADAVALPFATDSFDAVWSMSTLMHLPGDELRPALTEIARVVRTGGFAEIGVWGHTEDRDWTSPDGRFFRHRSDASLRAELSRIGAVVDFATWAWLDDGGHYQWARVLVGA